MYYTIYQITNLINGKIYIGKHQTKNLDDGYMGSGKLLYLAIKKYGAENFRKDILYVFDNLAEMNAKEKELVRVDETTYNLNSGGSGGFDYINRNRLNIYGNNGQKGYGGDNLHTVSLKNRMLARNQWDEHKQRMSKVMKENYQTGRLVPGFLGKTHTDETKQKMRGHANQTGQRNSQYGTCWVTHPELGVKKIKTSDIATYIEKGYTRGRVISK